MNRIKLAILIVIVVLAAVLRFYKLDQVPPSLNWDEVAAAYNAYTIANWGADEYGIKFPIVFKNFGDDKHPVHIYLTALIVKVFGLSDFSTRASSALIGTLSVLAIYFLARELLKSESAGLFSALFLAVSPYALQFSRGLWEANFALAFFAAGLAAFYIGLRKNNWFIPLSFLFFCLSFFSYHSAEVVVPPVVFLLSLINIKKLFANKKLLAISFGIVLLFGGLIVKDPRILGFARINQTKFSEEVTKEYGGELKTIIHNYKGYFTYSYLFQKGDQSPRGSVKVIGEFYLIDLPLLIIGFLLLLFRKRWQAIVLIAFWLALAPIPGAVSTIDTNATRGIFMIGPILLLSGFGAGSIIDFLRRKEFKVLIVILVILALGWEVKKYLIYYYTEYPKAEAIEWQYGMKQVVDFVDRNPDYVKVYMDKIRQQPYIFFLYYLKTPLPELLKTVKYDETESKSYNTVESYDKFQFGEWDIIHSYPAYKILYIVTPSYYSGLFYLNEFKVNDLIKYPDGSDAFYLVSGDRQ